MSFEAIIGFIVIAVISSLFNKSKEQNTAKRNETQRNDVPNRNEAPQRPASPQHPKTAPKPQPRPKRTVTGLEDMLRELQKNMRDTFEQYETKQEETITEISTTETVRTENKPLKQESKGTVVKQREKVKQDENIPSVISGGEIGRMKVSKVKFNRQSVIQGIIMSEVLGKPKSLRGREIR
ncbi:hypothetical protein [Alkaliphilus transvaalensis]|uniref:hypothetical protein n=1 Tax=Alkaliphilus transvaalensis TaxID=114628 RepID=UPI00047E5F07|nr:hypothetical protein [Alkaliphilus transvaalensis]